MINGNEERVIPMKQRLWFSWVGAAIALAIALCTLLPSTPSQPSTKLEVGNWRSQTAESSASRKISVLAKRGQAVTSSIAPQPDPNTTSAAQAQTVRSVSWDTHGWPQESSGPTTAADGFSIDVPMSFAGNQDPPSRMMLGVDQYSQGQQQREPEWNDQRFIPWESFAYGEYVGPARTPHVSDYRLRIGDRVDFVYLLDRGHSNGPYQIYSGDILSISSTADPSLNQPSLTVLSDGTIALQLIGQVVAAGKTLEALSGELNERFTKFVRKPDIVVQVVRGDTPLNDLRDAVDARAGQGGQSREVTVSPDGVVRLPLIGPVPAIGLSLDEIAEEVNARYGQRLRGISVTPILVQRAPRSVFVLGQVNRPGRIELQGPTSVMQAIAMAEGWRTGSNLRQIIVFRRDANWQLQATKIDLQGALNGRRPHPADEIWLRDSDIVLIPKSPIQRFSEAVDLYLARSLYAIFPQQGVVFNFDGFQSF